MEFDCGKFDIAVIGAGHAGIEAALAPARLGLSVVVFTINMDSVGNMPCNPAIGGTSKGHLVRELDALGGEMAHVADKTTIQSRMLNRGKGPSVYSLRAQIDRREYGKYMKHTLEKQENLCLKQAEIVALKKENGVFYLKTRLDAVYQAKAVIIATGTFLDGRVYVGEHSYSSGPDGIFPAIGLSESLRAMGIKLRRFKTGTPSRVNRRSIDFSKMEIQYGDEKVTPFSFSSLPPKNKDVCYMTYTTAETKRIIEENIGRSPLYSGKIEGIGPRYCPSIEDKIMRFPEKPRHQLFVEPCGLDTEEMYLQGMSSSLPEDVQLKFLRTIPGLENVEVMRVAYAIEYDCIDPVVLNPTLEFMDIENLYGAGQFNGSSGYEEAAVQGFVAGVNAALKILGRKPLILPRSGSYIGTLIDDLVTKGCNEPYRMMTSRSEFRLVLRQDNADLRLTRTGYEIGLVPKERLDAVILKENQIAQELKRVKNTVIAPGEAVNNMLIENNTAPLTTGCKIADLLKRPQLDYEKIAPFDPTRPDISDEVLEQVQTELKYEGYIKRQNAQIAEQKRLEERVIPPSIDYSAITGLRLEAVEKLSKIRPVSIGQASKISGVSPADINVLIVYLKSKKF